MSIFIQIIILAAILAAMVMVLLAVRQLSHFESFEDEKETTFLKEEVEDKKEVLSSHNIFHNLMEKEEKELKKEKVYSETSKDPLSRKE